MQKVDDEQLEGSDFVLNRIINVILEIIKSMVFNILHTLSCQKNSKRINHL